MSLTSILSTPPASATPPLSEAAEKKGQGEDTPLPLDEVISSQDESPLPSIDSLSSTDRSSNVTSDHANSTSKGLKSQRQNATGTDSRDVIKRLKAQLKSEKQKNAQLKEDNDHPVAMARMEDEIEDLKSANIRLHADLDMATTLLNQTQHASLTSGQAQAEAPAEAQAAEPAPTESEPLAGVAEEGLRIAAAAGEMAEVVPDFGANADDAPARETATVFDSGRVNSSQLRAEASFWHISAAADRDSPTVLLGGRNYSGDGSETDDEASLVNMSLAEGSGFSVAFTATWRQFHPFSRVLSLSDGSKDVLRVTSVDSLGTLSFSVRRCRDDGHDCQHYASVDVKDAIEANVTSRYLCSVSPEGKMQVYRDGRIIGRLKADGTYALPGQRGGIKLPASEAHLYVARRTWKQRGKGVPAFEGSLSDICLWSREVAPANAASCIEAK